MYQPWQQKTINVIAESPGVRGLHVWFVLRQADPKLALFHSCYCPYRGPAMAHPPPKPRRRRWVRRAARGRRSAGCPAPASPCRRLPRAAGKEAVTWRTAGRVARRACAVRARAGWPCSAWRPALPAARTVRWAARRPLGRDGGAGPRRGKERGGAARGLWRAWLRWRQVPGGLAPPWGSLRLFSSCCRGSPCEGLCFTAVLVNGCCWKPDACSGGINTGLLVSHVSSCNYVCPLGPALLFVKTSQGKEEGRRFYACSACRDRKDCNFFQWEDEKVREHCLRLW